MNPTQTEKEWMMNEKMVKGASVHGSRPPVRRRVSPMGKKERQRRERKFHAERRKMFEVFFELQTVPLRLRLKLARKLIFQTDIRHLAKEDGLSVKEYLER